MSETLPVAETFYTLQGEGPYAGTPAVFLRLGGCNLCCGGRDNLAVDDQEDMEPGEDAEWVCDTIEVWRDSSQMEVESLLQHWVAEDWMYWLKNGRANLVITGGEPMLHQGKIIWLIREMESRGITPTVEVETNGTIEPNTVMRDVVDQFNVSLKLDNSGMPEEERLVFDAIHQFIELGEEQAMFKFVVAQKDDLLEIGSLCTQYGIPKKQVMLMPAGATKEQLSETYPKVAQWCKQSGYEFSPRLHVSIWNQKTGV